MDDVWDHSVTIFNKQQIRPLEDDLHDFPRDCITVSKSLKNSDQISFSFNLSYDVPRS